MFDLQVIEVEHPGSFWGKEAPSHNMSETAKAFQKLQEDLNELFSDRKIRDRHHFPVLPQVGQHCVGKRQGGKNWFRMKILNIIPRQQHGPQAVCRLVDYGNEEQVPQLELYKLPPQFSRDKLSYQATLYGLYGIQPVTLITDPESMTTTPGPCTEWDPSATQFTKKILKESQSVKAVVMDEDCEGKKLLCVYIGHQDGDSLIDMLVDKQYAMYKLSHGHKKVFELGTEALSPVESLSAKELPFGKYTEFHQGLHSDSQISEDYREFSFHSDSQNIELQSTEKSQKQSRRQSHSPKGYISRRLNNAPKLNEGGFGLQWATAPTAGAGETSCENSELHKKLIMSKSSEIDAKNTILKGDFQIKFNSTSLEKVEGKSSTTRSVQHIGLGRGKIRPCDGDEMSAKDRAIKEECLSNSASGRGAQLGNALSLLQEPQVGSKYVLNEKIESQKFDQKFPTLQKTDDIDTSSESKVASGVGRGKMMQSAISKYKLIAPQKSPPSVQLPIPDNPQEGNILDLLKKVVSQATSHYSESETKEITRKHHGIPIPKDPFPIVANKQIGPMRGIADSLQETSTRQEEPIVISRGTKQKASEGEACGFMTMHMPKGQDCTDENNGDPEMPRQFCTPNLLLAQKVETPQIDEASLAAQSNLVPEKHVQGVVKIGLSDNNIPVPNEGPDFAGFGPMKGRRPKRVMTENPLNPFEDGVNRTQRTQPYSSDMDSAEEHKMDKKRISFSDSEEVFHGDSLILGRKPEIAVAPKSILKNSQMEEDRMAKITLPRTLMIDQLFDKTGKSDSERRINDIFAKAVSIENEKDDIFAYQDHSDREETCFEKGILVDASSYPQPVTTLYESGLSDSIKMVLERHDIESPTLMESYIWPALQRGRDVVVVKQIGPDLTVGGNDRLRDRCTGYLLPLISCLRTSSMHQGMPKGTGPLGVVLCSTWCRVEEVYQRACMICEDSKACRVVTLFGGGCEEKQEIPLMNGCELLVATPDSLLRTINRGVIALNRLGYLVLEEGDMLVEYFTIQVREIMSIYAKELSNRKKIGLPRQLILFASQWTEGITSFMQYMQNPMVLVDHKLEAAIYGNVRWEVLACSEQNRLSTLNQFLNPAFENKQKTVIFTSSTEEAETIYAALIQSHPQVILKLKVSSGVDYKSINREKTHTQQGTFPIYVIVDSALGSEVNLTDASRIIHYDVPRREEFNRRLWCLHENFHMRYSGHDRKNKNLERPVSVLLITEKCKRQAKTLKNILERVGAVIPTTLKDMVQSEAESQEMDKTVPLCHFTKAYGSCREQRCQDRHVISSLLDNPRKNACVLPLAGFVTVLVTHVVDVGCFYARLIHHEDSDEKYYLDHNCTALTLELCMWFNSADNRKKSGSPIVGDILCYEDTMHTPHRVEVKEIPQTVKNKESDKIKIWFVDIGKEQLVERGNLYLLPGKFLALPFQAIEVFIGNIKPFDEENHWTQRANRFVEKMLHGQELRGNIVLRLGNTLWLNPVVMINKLEHVKTVSYSGTLQQLILGEKLATKNQQHLKLLYALCQGKIEYPEVLQVEDVPGMGYNMYEMPVPYRTATLTDAMEQSVIVATVDTPEYFFLQLVSAESMLEELHRDISDYMAVTIINSHLMHNVKVGSLVIAQHPEEDTDEPQECRKWYRGKVMAVEGDSYDVFFLDYGDSAWVERKIDNLYPMPSRFLNHPQQAIECCLAQGSHWTNDCGDQLLKMTRNEENQNQVFHAKIMGVEPSTVAGHHRYKVQLKKWMLGFEIDILQELVINGFADISSTLIKEICQNPDGEDIPVLCEMLLGSKDSDTQVQLAQRIYQLTAKTASDLQMCSFHSLSHALGYLNQPAVIEFIVKCLSQLMNKMESVIPQNNPDIAADCRVAVINILRLLTRDSSVTTQQVVMDALLTLAQEQIYREYIIENNGLHCLSGKLENSELEVQMEAVKVISKLLLTEDIDWRLVKKSFCVERMCQVLQESSHRDLLMSTLCVLQYLVTSESHIRYIETIRKYGWLQMLCDKIQLNDIDQQVQEQMLILLQQMAERCSLTRDVMIDRNYRRDFTRLLDDERLSELSLNSLHLLLDLLYLEEDIEDLPIHIQPHINGEQLQKGIRPSPLPEPIKSSESSNQIELRLHAPVQWLQDKRNVVLRIKVPNVKQENPVKLDNNMLQFYAVADQKEYKLCLVLYELVSRYDVERKNSEVLIGLRKKSKGIWPRLTQNKVKLPYIMRDFENLMESSEEDSSDEEENHSDEMKSPLHILQYRHKPRAMLPPPPEGREKTHRQFMFKRDMTSSDSSSSSESDEDYDVDMNEDEKRYSLFSLQG